MPTQKKSKRPDSERMRRKAFSRWEDEGGAVACGPQVPGIDIDCEEPVSAERKKED